MPVIIGAEHSGVFLPAGYLGAYNIVVHLIKVDKAIIVIPSDLYGVTIAVIIHPEIEDYPVVRIILELELSSDIAVCYGLIVQNSDV